MFSISLIEKQLLFPEQCMHVLFTCGDFNTVQQSYFLAPTVHPHIGYPGRTPWKCIQVFGVIDFVNYVRLRSQPTPQNYLSLMVLYLQMNPKKPLAERQQKLKASIIQHYKVLKCNFNTQIDHLELKFKAQCALFKQKVLQIGKRRHYR